MTSVHSIDAGELQQELEQDDLPVLAAFLSPACSTCRLLAPFLEEIAVSHAGTVKVVQIDPSEDPALARVQSIQQVPTLVIFWKGHELERLVGLTSPYSLSVKLTQLAELTQFQPAPSAAEKSDLPATAPWEARRATAAPTRSGSHCPK